MDAFFYLDERELGGEVVEPAQELLPAPAVGYALPHRGEQLPRHALSALPAVGVVLQRRQRLLLGLAAVLLRVLPRTLADRPVDVVHDRGQLGADFAHLLLDLLSLPHRLFLSVYGLLREIARIIAQACRAVQQGNAKKIRCRNGT